MLGLALLIVSILFSSCGSNVETGSPEKSNPAAVIADPTSPVASPDVAALQIQHLWKFSGTVPGENYRSIAVGNDGTQIFSNVDGGSGGASLFAANQVEANTSPRIWNDGSMNAAMRGAGAAARSADAFVSLYFQTSANNTVIPRLELRRSTSSTPVWSKSFPAIFAYQYVKLGNVFVSKDGTKILAWWYNFTGTVTSLVGFDASGNALFPQKNIPNLLVGADTADDDLNYLFLKAQSLTVVISGSTGEPLKMLQSWFSPTDAISVGGNGSLLAIGNSSGAIDMYRTTGTNLFAGAYSIPAYTNQVSIRAALSKDGSTLAVGYRSLVNLHAMMLRIFNVGLTQATEVFSSGLLEGNGAYSTFYNGLLISSRGDLVIASTVGDQYHLVPALSFYNKVNGNWQLFHTADLPGSVSAMDWSSDERTLAVVSATAHYQASITYANVDVWSLYSELSLVGMPSVGSTVRIEHKSLPNTVCTLYKSSALAASPVNIGAVGALLLQGPQSVASMMTNAQGVASFEIPLTSGNAGQKTYYQASAKLDGDMRRLTTHAVPITIVPAP